jgi:riboflavin kinase/FMN adenylyltransferase
MKLSYGKAKTRHTKKEVSFHTIDFVKSTRKVSMMKRRNGYLCPCKMTVLNDIHQLPSSFRPFVTIGTFDGVHRGHKKVIQRLVERAQEQGVASMLITFDPHPREALGLGKIALLTDLEEKIALLKETALDYLLVIPFTQAFSQLTAKEFIDQYLVKRLNISGIILGYDHKFGNRREGNIDLLRHELEPLGIAVEEISAQAVDEIIISSTKIRHALSSGNPFEAMRLLGYPYSFEGVVVHGAKNGRLIGFPTANLAPNSASKVIPGTGVYAVQCTLDDQPFLGMMNHGSRPTVDGIKEVVEVHFLDFNSDIYGRTVRVQLYDRIRDEQKFNGLNELKEQLVKDEAYVRRRFMDS